MSEKQEGLEKIVRKRGKSTDFFYVLSGGEPNNVTINRSNMKTLQIKCNHPSSLLHAVMILIRKQAPTNSKKDFQPHPFSGNCQCTFPLSSQGNASTQGFRVIASDNYRISHRTAPGALNDNLDRTSVIGHGYKRGGNSGHRIIRQMKNVSNAILGSESHTVVSVTNRDFFCLLPG